MSIARLRGTGFRLLSLACVVGLWELSSRLVNLGDTYPAPSRVFPLFFKMLSDGELFGPLGSTLFRSALGFLLGFAIGLAYGVLAYAFPQFADYTRGVFTSLLFTPTLIIIFLGLIILGRTNMSVVVITGLAMCTEVGVYMRDAFGNFDRDLQRMAHSFRSSFGQNVRSMYLPFLVPPILVTARIGFTLAWKVTFLAEVFGFPGGLGWNVRLAYKVFDLPTLMAWLLVFIITLLLIEQAIRVTERLVVRW